MKKIIDRYHNLCIGSKLKLWFLFITLLPTVVLGYFSFHISMNTALDRYSSTLTTDLHLIDETVSERMHDVEFCGIRISVDPVVRAILKQETEQSKYMTDAFALQKVLYDYAYTSVLHSVYVFDNAGTCYSNFTWADSQAMEEHLAACGVDAAAQRRGAWLAPFEIGGAYVLPYVHSVYDYETDRYLGLVVVNYPKSALEEISRTYAEEASDVLVIDAAGNIVSAWDDTLLMQPARTVFSQPLPESGSTMCRVGGQRRFVTFCTSDNGRWRYAAVVEQRSVLGSGVSVVAVAAAVILLCAAAGTLLAVRVSGSITDPLQKLAASMNSVSGDRLDPAFEPRYQDEIGQLTRSFNDMTVRLNESISEKLEAEEKRREAEYRALTVQINPHFLYNTLSTIIYLNDMGRREEVDAVAAALSRLFRISISRGKEIITVEQELEHVRCYLEIQKIRYRDEFVYSIEADPALAQEPVIKLILQPLAENALYHGIRSSASTEMIRILARREGAFIRFEVRNTGGGLTEDEVFELNRYIRAPEPADGQYGIGLRNVSERVRMAYGRDCGVFLEIDGKETVAVVVIRPQEGEHENAHPDL